MPRNEISYARLVLVHQSEFLAVTGKGRRLDREEKRKKREMGQRENVEGGRRGFAHPFSTLDNFLWRQDFRIGTSFFPKYKDSSP